MTADLIEKFKALAARIGPQCDLHGGYVAGEIRKIIEEHEAAQEASQPASTPIKTGVRDNKGREICLGDRLRFLNKSHDTPEENWFPEYEVIWNPPSFILRHIGGGSNPDTPWLGLKYLSEQFETIYEAPAVQPVAVQDAARDAELLLSAYKGLLVLHRIMVKAGLHAGEKTTSELADRIVSAHPEFPALAALRAIAEGRPELTEGAKSQA